jgi:hypothetical protein
MEVCRDQTSAVIDVDGTACQIEIRHQSYDSSSGCSYRRPDSTGKVGAKVPALYLTVEHPSGSEWTRNPA